MAEFGDISTRRQRHELEAELECNVVQISQNRVGNVRQVRGMSNLINIRFIYPTKSWSSVHPHPPRKRTLECFVGNQTESQFKVLFPTDDRGAKDNKQGLNK